uniref:Reverse transcriptase domain-containing protein n=1 Tax=Strongyloides papillosus TaxID=174720 RepID=A0A0N5BYR9_STREA
MTNTTPANTARSYDCCLQVQLFDYKSKTRSVGRFINEMEEAMFLDQIDEQDRATRIRLLRLRCTTETKELLPDMDELTYEQYKSALIDLFPPVPPAVFMMEYISYKVLPSEESFTKLRELADRAYKNKPMAEKKASVILRLMEAFNRHENVWTYLSQSHTDTTISTIISEVSRMVLLNKDRKFKLQSNVSCDHCMISGHIASQCRRKQSGMPQGDYRKKPTPNPTVRSVSKSISALFDTGSTCTAISSTLAKSLNIEKGTDTVDIKYLNTQSSAITPRNKLLITLGNRLCYCYPVIINNASSDIIIDQSELQKLRISFLFSPNKVEINAIECNQTSLKNRILSETSSVNPRYDIQNPIVRGKCKQHVLKMISHNLASRYAPQFICNLRPVEKKSGDIRMTLDMRPVNEITVPIYYSSQKINFILHSMGTFDFISRLDLRNAYTQIPLDPADNRTIGGHIDGILFSQLRLPQGGRNSSAIIQYIIDQVLADTPSMAFQNDIWIRTKGTASLHSDEVISTCKALVAHNLKISLDKSVFLSNETILLGHRITKKGTAIALKLISTITSFSRPTNTYQLWKFRGIFNFCKRYIKDYSVHEPIINKFISNTPKKDSKALVTIPDSVLQSIDLIKQQVQNAYSLAHVQYDYPFILTVDSSLSGMDAVLLQPSTKIFDIQKSFAKVLHCVGLFSRQHHYRNIPPIVVLELKAISASLTFFGEFIQGCPVHIYSDHKILLFIIRESQYPKYDKYIYWISE